MVAVGAVAQSLAKLAYWVHWGKNATTGSTNTTRIEIQELLIEWCTWFFPLTPKWGLASVTKLTGTRPATLASWWHCNPGRSWLCLCGSPSRTISSIRSTWGVYSAAIAYLAKRPPSEWATNDIRVKLGVPSTICWTCIIKRDDNIFCLEDWITNFRWKPASSYGWCSMIKTRRALPHQRGVCHKSQRQQMFGERNSQNLLPQDSPNIDWSKKVHWPKSKTSSFVAQFN